MDARRHAWGLGCLAATVAIGLAGCGPSSGNQTGGFSQAFSAAYEKSFNEQFAKTTHDSCVSSAVAHQASADLAERYCTCFVGQFQSLSVAEKQQLTPDSPKVAQAAATCKAQVQPTS
jgi:hypothetical protein